MRFCLPHVEDETKLSMLLLVLNLVACPFVILHILKQGDKNAEADALHWGRQKARGAEPVKGGGAYGQTVAADAADAAAVDARATAPAALVGKAALLASSRDAAPTVLNDARAQTLFP